MTIYLLQENPDWAPPMLEALVQLGVSGELIDLREGQLDLSQPAPEGVFFCRVSASAYSRGNQSAYANARAWLSLLVSEGRSVVNGIRALELELSKAKQFIALKRAGMNVPDSRFVAGPRAVLEAAETIGYPVVLKPNCGGKGLGVRRFDDRSSLEGYLQSDEVDVGADGLLVVQALIDSAEGVVMRHEFVGGEHLYSVRVQTGGAFELCPADGCAIGATGPRFDVELEYQNPVLEPCGRMLFEAGVEVAGVETMTDRAGQIWAYDINVNTNYNREAELRAGLERGGALRVAELLRARL